MHFLNGIQTYNLQHKHHLNSQLIITTYTDKNQDTQSGKPFIRHFLNAGTLAISKAHSWIDGISSFLHPLRIICLAIITLVWTQLFMCLSNLLKMDPSPKTNSLVLNGTYIPAIKHKLSCVAVQNSWTLSKDKRT